MASVQQEYKTPYTIALEANIGGGKSTLLEFLKAKNFRGVEFLDEPITEWCSLNNNNLFSLASKNPERWLFQFQCYTQLTLLKRQTVKSNAKVRVIERSLGSAENVFIRSLQDCGYFDDLEVSILDAWNDFMKKICPEVFVVDQYIYLKTTPDEALRRCKQRNREEEKTVDLTYLTSLSNQHDKWLLGKESSKTKMYDVNRPLSELQTTVYKDIEKLISSLL